MSLSILARNLRFIMSNILVAGRKAEGYLKKSIEVASQIGAIGILGQASLGLGVLYKARLWQRINKQPVNDRQRLVINRLLDGFKGFLTTSKYAKLAKYSTDTALRDIALSLLQVPVGDPIIPLGVPPSRGAAV